MDDAKRVLALFLGLLFVIIVIGVVVNRVAKEKANIPIIGGALERVLFPKRPTPGVEEKELAKKTDSKGETGKTADGTVVIKKTSTATTTTGGGDKGASQTEAINAGATTSVVPDRSLSSNSGAEKGAETIPSTGAPALMTILSLSGLSGGILLKRKVS